MPFSEMLPTSVVLDTNVVLDLWHFDDVEARELRILLETRALHVVTSKALDDELHDVMSREQFIASRGVVLKHWRALSTTIAVNAPAPWMCHDKHDQKLLDLAVSSRAAALITKDKALLTLARRAACASLMIASPKDYLARGSDRRVVQLVN
jgi:putative PIN family toxin of toxin-antitoxin system